MWIVIKIIILRAIKWIEKKKIKYHVLIVQLIL